MYSFWSLSKKVVLVGSFYCTELNSVWKNNFCNLWMHLLQVLRAFKIKEWHRCTDQATSVHRQHAGVPVAVAALGTSAVLSHTRTAKDWLFSVNTIIKLFLFSVCEVSTVRHCFFLGVVYFGFFWYRLFYEPVHPAHYLQIIFCDYSSFVIHARIAQLSNKSNSSSLFHNWMTPKPTKCF